MSAQDFTPLHEIEAALSYISSDDRQTWITVSFILADEYGDAAGNAFINWSSTSPSYDEKDAEKKWRQALRHNPSGKAAGLGTIIQMAKQNGWVRHDSKPVPEHVVAKHREQREQRRAALELEAKTLADAAASLAESVWAAAEGAPPDHPYLEAKGIYADCKYAESVKLEYQDDGESKSYTLKQCLVIPIWQSSGKLSSLQLINPQGEKHFIAGGIKRGGYCVIGKITKLTPKAVICEGYATGASIFMATSLPVIVAFDAGNLMPVAEKMHQALPDTAFIIAADNDKYTAGNPGLRYGSEAAAAIGATMAYPEFFGHDTSEPTDFNDQYQLYGLQAVQDTIKAASQPKQYNEPTPALEPIHGDPNHWHGGQAFDLFSRMPVPKIDADMLPDVITAYAFDQAELLGVNPGMIAIPAIVACASVIHDEIKIQPKRYETGWTESARLWVGIVGDPSIKKTPSIKRAVSRVKKIDIELAQKNERALANHIRALDDHKIQSQQNKQAGIDAPERPKEPPLLRQVVEDATVEAISQILKDNPRGVLCIRDELSGWFGSMDAYSGGKASGKDRANWLELYNGGHRVVDRITRGSLLVPNWSACMVGAIQPDMIRKIASKMDSDGLMQRFMIIMGENTGREQDRPDDAKAKAEYRDLIDSLYKLHGHDDPVILSEGAHLVREKLDNYITEFHGYDSLPSGFKSHLGKWQGLFARLLLTYHVIECNSMGDYPNSRDVSADTANQVARLMMRYLLPNAASFYMDLLSSSGTIEDSRWIAGHILSKNLSRISTRDIANSYKAWRELSDWERHRIMNGLFEMGWIKPEKENQGKGIATSWLVNMDVHEQFNDHAQREIEQRRRMRERFIQLQMGQINSD